jgi:hypothetical protein
MRNAVRNKACLGLLVLVAFALCACGGKKRYLQQVMPLIEQNDAVDSHVAKLPRINAYKDPDYLTKLDSYIRAKESLRAEMELIEPPFLLSTTHTKLLQAMQNGIRYLYSEREKYVIAAAKIAKTAPRRAGEREEFGIIRDYQSQTAAAQANMKEQLMKQQYFRLYDEVKDELARAQRL